MDRRIALWPLAVQKLLLLAALASLSISSLAWAQSSDDVHVVPRSKSQGEADGSLANDPELHTRPLRADVDLVLVPVTVSDSWNRPMLNLRQQDFKVYEGTSQQQVRYFSREDAPISVALVLDCSASMKNKIEYEYQALQEFLSNANSGDEYFAVTVSDKPKLIATASDSVGTMQDRLSAAQAKGRTALYDAIYLAISQLRTARYNRKALLIISDGGDNTSRYTRSEIKNVIEEADVLTYAIGIFDEEPIPLLKSLEERMGRDWLSELTDASGGRTIAADDRRKIPDIAALISRELRNQYVLGYRPDGPLHDGKWHRITVKVAPGSQATRLQVHYRERYRAPSE
jgi:Ca-activated chloride channel homolog